MRGNDPLENIGRRRRTAVMKVNWNMVWSIVIAVFLIGVIGVFTRTLRVNGMA
jgi:hypothetical protein